MRTDVYSESAVAPGVDVAQAGGPQEPLEQSADEAVVMSRAAGRAAREASAESCQTQSSVAEDSAICGSHTAGELRRRASQHTGWRAVLQGMADAVSGPFELLSRCAAESAETHDVELSRQRLQLRLDLFGIEERPILGDGNCQFASVSDQLYGTPRHHATVRATVVQRLKSEPERYSPYVQGASFEEYLEDVAASGTWGDHVTLQALADAFGLRLVLVTSFAQDCIVEILPCKKKSGRVLWLSFLAELHYSSLYPKGEVPEDAKTSCTIC